MNRSDLRETYYEASSTLSTISRQLCFAGIAVIWMFKTQSPDNAGIRFAWDLLLPLGGFIASLSFDLFQYIYKTAAFGFYNRLYEVRMVSEKANFKAPIWINWFTLFFFWGKQVFVILSYLLLIWYISKNLF